MALQNRLLKAFGKSPEDSPATKDFNLCIPFHGFFDLLLDTDCDKAVEVVFSAISACVRRNFLDNKNGPASLKGHGSRGSSVLQITLSLAAPGDIAPLPHPVTI
jgi:hypothetical protein